MQDLNANGPAASWSPDGTRLVFQGSLLRLPGPNTNEVYIANANGSGSVTPLTRTRATPPARPGGPTRSPTRPAGDHSFGHPQLRAAARPDGQTDAEMVHQPHLLDLRALRADAERRLRRARLQRRRDGHGEVLGRRRDQAPTGAGGRAGSKPKGSKKPKTIVVASGKVHVPSNQTRVLKLKLTKVAIAILKKVGKLKMTVTVTTTIAGQAPTQGDADDRNRRQAEEEGGS